MQSTTAQALPDDKLFTFGLDEAQENRAAQLHRESLIIDLLYQGPIGPETFPLELEEEIHEMLTTSPRDVFSLYKLMSEPVRRAVANKLDQFRTQWLASGVTGGNREIELAYFEIYADLMGLAQSQFDNLSWMVKAVVAEDFRTAKRQQLAAGFISTQMVSGPFPSLEILRHGWESGLRMVQLTYNEKNTLGCGCTDKENSGVTDFGRSAILLMNDLGVIVDTGHCGERTTLDACEISSRPVVASHTAASGIYHHDRCKSDDELRAIAETGGVIGVVAVPFFLQNGKNVTLNDMLNHIDYIAELVGPEHVAIGTDWPSQIPYSILNDVFADVISSVGFRSEHNVNPSSTIDGFRDYLDFPNITRGLVSRDYSDSEIKGILGENFLRVFKEVCG